jgi:hypothetical protein
VHIITEVWVWRAELQVWPFFFVSIRMDHGDQPTKIEQFRREAKQCILLLDWITSVQKLITFVADLTYFLEKGITWLFQPLHDNMHLPVVWFPRGCNRRGVLKHVERLHMAPFVSAFEQLLMATIRPDYPNAQIPWWLQGEAL